MILQSRPRPRAIPRPSAAPLVLCALALAGGLAGCGDDGPTTTSASTPSALAAQGDRGGTATAPTPSPGGALGDYVAGGRPATSAEAVKVRAGFRGFAEAVVVRDAQAACTHVTGFAELLRARGQTGDCATLLPNIGNAAAGPSASDLQLIDDADVVVARDRATLSLGSEAPVPMRRVGGQWKLDYAAFAAAPKGR